MSFKINLDYTLPISILKDNKDILIKVIKDYSEESKELNNIIDEIKNMELNTSKNFGQDEIQVYKSSDKLIIFSVLYVDESEMDIINNLFKKYKIPFDLYILQTEDSENVRYIYRPENEIISFVPTTKTQNCELELCLPFSVITDILKNSKNEKELKDTIQQKMNQYIGKSLNEY